MWQEALEKDQNNVMLKIAFDEVKRRQDLTRPKY